MEGSLKKLKPYGPIYDFSNHPIDVKGFVLLPVTLGDSRNSVTIDIEFFVVNQPSAYNVLFGRPLIRDVKLILETSSLQVKFSTPYGEGYMEAYKQIARKCHLRSF
ncbi:hypothetical protein V6N13_124129 [Hibiscus sabdariffa]|uniref:Uncharacterized protein n=1 Tax=Hibiscus sabdariffa TaxID=183260 RepID=A0ABR2S0K3_9ROSI